MSNVLVDKVNGPADEMIFVLADYGLSHEIDPSSGRGSSGKCRSGTFPNWAPGSVPRHPIPSAFTKFGFHAWSCFACQL